jgi:ubiquinone/menaquinone biosynthesis C-methylase UbiE
VNPKDFLFPIYRSQLSVFNYEEIPPGYYFKAMESGSAPQRFWHKFKFLNVAERIDANDKVLDFGCGPGSFLSVLNESGQFDSAVGVDLASNQIEFAKREIAPKSVTGKLKFIGLDANSSKMPFEDNTFDVITLIEVIEHIHPYVVMRIFEELKRVLKPDGRFIVTTPNYRSLWPAIEYGLNKFSPVKYHDQHINKYTPNSLIKFLETAGLEITHANTFFVISPFLSGISWGMARALYEIEKKIFRQFGDLMLAEARVSPHLIET